MILDPAVAFDGGEENDNVQRQQFAMALRRIARDHNCSVLAVHHEAKGTNEINVETAGRGASSLRDAARFALRCLNVQPTDKNISRLGAFTPAEDHTKEQQARHFVRIEHNKSNYSTRHAPFYCQRMTQNQGLPRWIDIQSIEDLQDWERLALDAVQGYTKTHIERNPSDFEFAMPNMSRREMVAKIEDWVSTGYLQYGSGKVLELV